MMTRLTAPALLVGAAAAALIASAPTQAAPPAPASPGQNCAAGYMSDPNSGNCWQMAGHSPSVGGGPCMPGRVGSCLGYLANNPMAPGDMLPDIPSTDSWS
jgi:hypothetical protein